MDKEINRKGEKREGLVLKFGFFIKHDIRFDMLL